MDGVPWGSHCGQPKERPNDEGRGCSCLASLQKNSECYCPRYSYL